MAALKPYRVSGSFKMGSRTSPFAIETLDADAQKARDRVLSTLGSKHRVDRHHVKVDAVKEIPAAEVTDPVIQHQLKKGA